MTCLTVQAAANLTWLPAGTIATVSSSPLIDGAVKSGLLVVLSSGPCEPLEPRAPIAPVPAPAPAPGKPSRRR